MTETQPLVEVKNLVKHFPVTRGVIIQRKVGAVRAVDGITFDIQPGETLGLVGEFWLWEDYCRSDPVRALSTHCRGDQHQWAGCLFCKR